MKRIIILSSLFIFSVCLQLISIASAEIKVDENLKHNFSYIKDAPPLRSENVTLFMVAGSKQKEISQNKSTFPSACFAMNKESVTCKP